MLIEPNSEGRFRQPGSPEDEREFNRERNEELAAALAGEIDWQTRCADLERQHAAMREALEGVMKMCGCRAEGQLICTELKRSDPNVELCFVCKCDVALLNDAGRAAPMDDAALAKFEADSRKVDLMVGTNPNAAGDDADSSERDYDDWSP